MKHEKIIFIIALAAIMTGCQSTASQQAETVSNPAEAVNVQSAVFSDITGKEWKLSEINLVDSFIIIDRDKLTQENSGDFFTLIFDAEMVSGKGEPNRYSAPYTLGDNQKINIMPMRSTMMASFFPNEVLNEHEFFLYLQSVHEWKLAGEKLELLSKAADGSGARLVWVSE